MRILLTRILGWAVAVLVLSSASRWVVEGPELVGELMFAAGGALTAVGFLGRIWCLSHIGGRKKRLLVITGPYALCRHPLYLCSLVGGLGLALCSRRMSVAGVYLVASLVFLPAAIVREERLLARQFDDFVRYRERVPALFPRWRLLEAPLELSVHERSLRRALLETIGYFSSVGILQLLAALQRADILPYAFTLP